MSNIRECIITIPKVIHIYIDLWHNHSSINSQITLYDFLGLSLEEYARWLMIDELPKF